MARPVKGYPSSRTMIQLHETMTGKFWKCRNCNQILKSRVAAIIHSNRKCKTSAPASVQNKSYMCGQCGIVFYDSKTWVDHEALHLANCKL